MRCAWDDSSNGRSGWYLFVTDNGPGHRRCSPDRFAEELDRCILVPPGLQENIQQFAFTINGAPQIHLLTADLQKHLIDMPSGAGLRPLHPKPFRVLPAKLFAPSADRLIGHVNTTLCKEVFDIPIAQSETEIQPDGMLDDG